VFLFILESIGTSELILIGIIALIFLGPRKLPQIAKTIGKTMADFRNTTNEF
jgi:sec-independent protein translocase protein TatB